MEHPLITNIDHLNIENLQSKITELTRKLGIAHRMGNAQLVGQIRMALETYQTKLAEKQSALYADAQKETPDFSNIIDIS